MTTPVTTDDIVQAAVKWLQSFTDVKAVLGTEPGTTTPYLFQNTLQAPIEGSSTTAAVISRAGGWTVPNEHNTMRFPRLSLEIWADPQRDDGGNENEPGEVYRRAEAAFLAIDKRLHRPHTEVQMWGTLRTLGCSRLTEPIVYPVPDGNGMLRLQTFYAVVQG